MSEIAYSIRRSERARRVRVSVDAERGVEVVLPRRARRRDADAAVRELRPWIERRLHELERARVELGAREGRPSPRAPIVLLPWREVAERHAVQARAAAEAILGAIELAGAGPVRLKERLMGPLLGVDAPALMLDCATLSAIPDRLRLEDPRGLAELAAAIAEGVARWARGA